MKSSAIALLALCLANSFASAATDLLKVDPWSARRHDVALTIPGENSELAAPTRTLGEPSEVSPLTAPVEDLFQRNYWYLVLLDVKEVFTAPAHWDNRDWLMLGGVVAGIGTVAVFDEDINRAIQRNKNGTVNDVLHAVEPFGNEYAIGVVGSFYIFGEIFKDPRAKTTALDAISASALASGIITNVTKYAIGRSRPLDHEGAYKFQPFSGRDSFSSGHTAEAFALASVISEHYPTPWVQVTSYGIAGLVGYARISEGRHWTSDVLAGAAIGTFVGKTVVYFNQRHRRVAVQPLIGTINGAEFSYSW
jgi:hypothetical protein